MDGFKKYIFHRLHNKDHPINIRNNEGKLSPIDKQLNPNIELTQSESCYRMFNELDASQT